MASTRRLFLGSVSGAAGAVLAQAQTSRASLGSKRVSPLDGVKREKIKITDIQVMNLGYRLKPEEEWPDADNNVIIWKTESVIVMAATNRPDVLDPALLAGPAATTARRR